MVAWLLAIGSALFALCLRYGLDQRATLDDTIFESFILLGAIALPICIVRLWRAANKPVKWSGASAPPTTPGSAAASAAPVGAPPAALAGTGFDAAANTGREARALPEPSFPRTAIIGACWIAFQIGRAHV